MNPTDYKRANMRKTSSDSENVFAADDIVSFDEFRRDSGLVEYFSGNPVNYIIDYL